MAKMSGINKNRQDTLKEIFLKFVSSDLSQVNSAIDELDRYVGRKLAEVSATKIRNIYAIVKKAARSQDPLRELIYLKYKLVYIAAKENKKHVYENLRNFSREVSELVGEIVSSKGKYLEEFFVFFEALVAYHRKYAD